MKKFSFIIPVYNNWKLLKNTLEALNYQEGFCREDYEVVIVDDGSDDDTLSYIRVVNRNYSLKYIFLERCKDSCAARARNYGWRNADGEVIVFIDADIIVRSNYLKELERYYSKDRNILVIGSRLMLKEDITVDGIQDKSVFEKYTFTWERPELHEFRYQIFDENSFNASALKCPWLMSFTCNMSMYKCWLEKIDGFDENFKCWGLEDVELSLRLYLAGIKIVINSKLEVMHQFHGTGNDKISPEKYSGIDKNVDYFLSKHPNALEMPNDEVHALFKGKDFNYSNINENISKIEVLNLKNRDKLEELKNAIVMLTEDENVVVIINDYVEDVDLDLWIQFLDERKTVPLYFTASRRSIGAEIRNLDVLSRNGELSVTITDY